MTSLLIMMSQSSVMEAPVVVQTSPEQHRGRPVLPRSGSACGSAPPNEPPWAKSSIFSIACGPFFSDQAQHVLKLCQMSRHGPSCASISSIMGGPFSPIQAQHVAKLCQNCQISRHGPESAASRAAGFPDQAQHVVKLRQMSRHGPG